MNEMIGFHLETLKSFCQTIIDAEWRGELDEETFERCGSILSDYCVSNASKIDKLVLALGDVAEDVENRKALLETISLLVEITKEIVEND